MTRGDETRWCQDANKRLVPNHEADRLVLLVRESLLAPPSAGIPSRVFGFRESRASRGRGSACPGIGVGERDQSTSPARPPRTSGSCGSSDFGAASRTLQDCLPAARQEPRPPARARHGRIRACREPLRTQRFWCGKPHPTGPLSWIPDVACGVVNVFQSVPHPRRGWGTRVCHATGRRPVPQSVLSGVLVAVVAVLGEQGSQVGQLDAGIAVVG